MRRSRLVQWPLALAALASMYSSAEDKKERPNVPPKVDDIRENAVRGGYEDKLDKSLDKYGGTRTKEVVEESRKIRSGAYQGSGHSGDNDQPGMSGREGKH